MNKIITFLILILGTCLVQSTNANGVSLGVYDTTHSFDNVRNLGYEQIWLEWNRYSSGQLLPQLKSIASKGRTPVITIEPYGGGDLLKDITGGKYDSVIQSLAKEVASFKSSVLIRFAPEMERDNGTPWSGKSVSAYVAANRHFVSLFRSVAPNSSQIWSPLGNPGAGSYYPGNDVVDYVGFSVYELPTATIKWNGRPYSFADWMKEKYPPMARFGKPVIITELGVTGTDQHAWLKAAVASAGQFPLVKVIIYYNHRDPVSWSKFGVGFSGYPDWSISPSAFSGL